MNIKLLIGGKEIDAQISEEDAQKIQPSESRFVRKNIGANYLFCCSGEKQIIETEDCYSKGDNNNFETGNYFTSEKQAQDHIRALKLWQAIKVFRQEREGNEQKKPHVYAYIYFDKSSGKLLKGFHDIIVDANVRFAKGETAQAVIDEFYGELMWYFTEFEDD